MGLKIFVSYARDLYGRGQPQGTCVLNRTLYKKSVLKLNKTSHPSQDIFNTLLSFDGKEFICKTCHFKVNQSSFQCQLTTYM